MLDRSPAPAPTSALTEAQLAARWVITPKTLQAWRLRGVGPAYIKVGHAVRYLPEVIAAYEAANTHKSTSAA